MSLDMQEFAEFLRIVREQSKISIQDFAHMCGISTPQNIGRIELGKVTAPSFDTMERILKVINRLDIIKNNDFCYDGYSESLINTLNRFRDDNDKIKVDKPIVNELPDDLTDASKQDTEIAFAIIALIKEYPAFRDELHKLHRIANLSFSNPEDADYSDVINDLTSRGNTKFYFSFNESVRKFVRTRSCTHAYEFMTLLVSALSTALGNYDDADIEE